MYRALSLFSGIGGLCEGVKLAGFNIVGAAELDKYAAESYRANFPETPLYEGDVYNFLNVDSLDYAEQFKKYVNGPIDLVFGGPPCQGFSQIGPRDPLDPRNELYMQLCRISQTVNAKAIIIENVPNMILMKGGMFKERIFKALTESGFSNIGLLKLCADQYGVPQSRHRIFFVAIKDGLIKEHASSIFSYVSEIMRKPMVTVDDALSDLPEQVAEDSGMTLQYPHRKGSYSSFMQEMRVDISGEKYSSSEKNNMLSMHGELNLLHNHHTKSVQEKRQHIINILQPGAKADSLPKELWDNKRPEKWRRFKGDAPAHTLLAHMHRDLSEWIHPHYNRWITVREALRLQGFHDGFVLKTSEWQQLKQVGNAVPPFLGEVPAQTVKLMLDISSGISNTENIPQLALF